MVSQLSRKLKGNKSSHSFLFAFGMSLLVISPRGRLMSRYLEITWRLLQSKCLEGKKAFESAWRELKDTGYLLQFRMKNAQNQFYYEYELADTPVKSPVPQKVVYGKGGIRETDVPQKECTWNRSIPNLEPPQNGDDIPIPYKPIVRVLLPSYTQVYSDIQNANCKKIAHPPNPKVVGT